MPTRVHIAPDLRDAIAEKRPVVALETTIVSHGMPYPDNLATARALEAVVREAGGIPATIAVIEGSIRIGLDSAELELLATGKGVLKLSRNDLAYAVAARKTGATTVAATMICAHLAGIRVFATGGIGGVHRGAADTFDISADIEELAQTPIAVVCAGAKALLDLPKTLEALETRGVPVVGYRTDEFPAFWSRTSGLRAPLRLDSPAEIAALMQTQHDLGLNAATLICNPPREADEIPAAEIAGHIRKAVAEADSRAITGKAVTPFILARVVELTGGRSLRTNIGLVKANARLGAEIACSLSPSAS